VSCEHCGSTNGHWFTTHIWECDDCGENTKYFEITEKGKTVLKELLGKPVDETKKRENDDEVS